MFIGEREVIIAQIKQLHKDFEKRQSEGKSMRIKNHFNIFQVYGPKGTLAYYEAQQSVLHDKDKLLKVHEFPDSLSNRYKY